jgi:hypothetical protein
LQHGSVPVEVQIVAEKLFPSDIAGVLLIDDLSEGHVTMASPKPKGVNLVTRDGDKLCGVELDNGNKHFGLRSVTQRLTTVSKLDMHTESQNRIFDRMILRDILCGACCARRSSICCDRIECANKEKELKREKTAYQALLAVQSSEEQVPANNEDYDPSEAVILRDRLP